MMKNLSVDGDRLWANILELGSIGKDQSGVSRVSFNDYDMQARHWLLSRMRFAGLDSHIDEVGNVFGTVPSSCSKNILVGSHTDTVPNGGMFDGALGVLAALECAQTIAENNIEIKAGIRIAVISQKEQKKTNNAW